eukprot:5974607-Ditylum_brightwellii.AAC.1
MEACIRSGLYEDALSIAAFANALERRHSSTKGAVVTQVVTDVRKREVDLRFHLLHKLKGDVSMPQCLEVVTALRRLNGVELERSKGDVERLFGTMELKLQVAFLEARDLWLDAALVVPDAGIVKDSSKGGGSQSERILDSIDSYRT